MAARALDAVAGVGSGGPIFEARSGLAGVALAGTGPNRRELFQAGLSAPFAAAECLGTADRSANFCRELVLLAFALRDSEWVAAQPGLAGVAHFGAVADALNRILSIGCFVALLVRAVQFIFRCIRSWREWTQKSGVGSLSAI